jgi:hypothetical protein
MEVAMLLLQCDPSDFHGPLEPIAKWYDALSDAYVCYKKNNSSSNLLDRAEKTQAVILVRLLFQHLTEFSKMNLMKKFEQNIN